jgi:uracil-DNA glycosylase
MTDFCPGYVVEPFKTLAASYPDDAAYPPADFRTEWGPVFHRGRLDGSARVLVIGQDPGQHENVLRRILSGEAGRRVQGLLAKLGITRSYVMVNALLYSVYGSGGAKYVARPAVAGYRDQWLAGILAPGKIEAVIAFGTMAHAAWDEYTKTHGAPAGVAFAPLTHPTYPESAGGTKAEHDANMAKMLQQWNAALPVLNAAIQHKDAAPASLVLYGATITDAEKASIPPGDLPAGTPAWMYADDGWASRGYPSKLPAPATDEDKLRLKREIIVIKAPAGAVP